MLINKTVTKIVYYTFILIIFDQLVKWWMVTTHPSLLLKNQAVLFGLINNQIIGYILLISGFICLIWLAIINTKTISGDSLSTSLVFAGVLSNIIDRLFRGGVYDYINLGFWPVFNLADVFIFIGVIFFCYKTFFINKNGI